jgi:hypothetical protein
MWPAHPAQDLAITPAGRIRQAQAGGFGAVGLPAPLTQGLRCRRRPGGAACIAACRFAYTVAMSKRKDPAAVKLGRKGGLKRMAMLTPQERTDLARRAALKRWRRAKPEK